MRRDEIDEEEEEDEENEKKFDASKITFIIKKDIKINFSN